MSMYIGPLVFRDGSNSYVNKLTEVKETAGFIINNNNIIKKNKKEVKIFIKFINIFKTK